MTEFDGKAARTMAQESTSDHAWVWADTLIEACDEIERLREASIGWQKRAEAAEARLIKAEKELAVFDGAGVYYRNEIMGLQVRVKIAEAAQAKSGEKA